MSTPGYGMNNPEYIKWEDKLTKYHMRGGNIYFEAAREFRSLDYKWQNNQFRDIEEHKDATIHKSSKTSIDDTGYVNLDVYTKSGVDVVTFKRNDIDPTNFLL